MARGPLPSRVKPGYGEGGHRHFVIAARDPATRSFISYIMALCNARPNLGTLRCLSCTAALGKPFTHTRVCINLNLNLLQWCNGATLRACLERMFACCHDYSSNEIETRHAAWGAGVST